jgi:hypothetical protein
MESRIKQITPLNQTHRQYHDVIFWETLATALKHLNEAAFPHFAVTGENDLASQHNHFDFFEFLQLQICCFLKKNARRLRRQSLSEIGANAKSKGDEVARISRVNYCRPRGYMRLSVLVDLLFLSL